MIQVPVMTVSHATMAITRVPAITRRTRLAMPASVDHLEPKLINSARPPA
jgi:hypothetical protein